MGEPEATADGRYIVVDGRRWRATDPAIPESLRRQLVDELMDARRAVRSDPDTARPRVRDAKVALGERGEPWWEDPSDEGRRTRIESAIRAMAHARAPKTLCPSEVARIVGGEQWRLLMPLVREIADDLSERGVIRVTQTGVPVVATEVKGPIRLSATDAMEPEDP